MAIMSIPFPMNGSEYSLVGYIYYRLLVDTCIYDLFQPIDDQIDFNFHIFLALGSFAFWVAFFI